MHEALELTLAEFYAVNLAVERMQLRAARFPAKMTAYLMACWVKKPPTVGQLLGVEEARESYAQASDDDKEAMLSRVTRKMEGQ